MASTVSAYFKNAELALAAYATDLFKGMPTNQFVGALTFAGMTEKQAAAFASTYEIINKYSDVAHSQ